MKTSTLLAFGLGLILTISNIHSFAQTISIPGGVGGIGTSINSNVGIGTNAPLSKLHLISNVGEVLRIESSSTFSGINLSAKGTGGLDWIVKSTANEPSIGSGKFAIAYNNTHHLIIDASGKVGVGTHEMPGARKLYVKGGILATEIEVEAFANWSDFVFAPEYKLMPLDKVEKFIKANRHLPEIPSAQVVAQKGFKLAEMDAKLLQKIEELTLHAIAQNKKIDELLKKYQAQEQRIQQLEKQLGSSK
ncbi:MAG: hypothetical protein ACPGJS_13510 [Flammeovirgaceae bacterium]